MRVDLDDAIIAGLLNEGAQRIHNHGHALRNKPYQKPNRHRRQGQACADRYAGIDARPLRRGEIFGLFRLYLKDRAMGLRLCHQFRFARTFIRTRRRSGAILGLTAKTMRCR